MLVQIITFFSLSISICMGHILPHGDQDHKDRHAENDIDKFYEENLPISNRYSAYNPFQANLKDDKDPHGFSNTQNLRSMQYAPLAKPGRIELQNTKPNKVLYNNEKSYEVKKHLEPKLEELPTTIAAITSLQQKTYPLTHFDFVPGKNIQVLRSINRISGHNAVYRNYGDEGRAESEAIKEINYQNKYVPKVEQTTKLCNNPAHITANYQTIATTPSTTTTDSIHEPKEYYISRPIKYIVEKQIAPEKTTLTRTHSLLLNVARYNRAMVPFESLHGDSAPGPEHLNFSNLNQLPSSNVTGPTESGIIAETERKTYLYPIHKKVLFST